MTRYIAFLRAINTAGRYIKSEQLRAAFEAVPGLRRVETFINSGNVLFDAEPTSAADLEREIEAHLPGALGFAAPTFLRTPAEMAAVAAHKPFPGLEDEDNTVLYVTFVRCVPAPEQREKLLALANPADQLDVFENHIFWLHRRSQEKSLVDNNKFERILASQSTTRNITTVRKITELLWS
jgi:uncharacterized protein (DUF1697 family)